MKSLTLAILVLTAGLTSVAHAECSNKQVEQQLKETLQDKQFTVTDLKFATFPNVSTNELTVVYSFSRVLASPVSTQAQLGYATYDLKACLIMEAIETDPTTASK